MLPQSHRFWSTLLGLGIFGLVFALRMRRRMQPRRLRLSLMWIIPALFLGFSALVLIEEPVRRPSDWGWLALAFLLGGAVGWVRGRLIRISRDPATSQLMAQASPAAMIFIVAYFLLRFGARAYLIPTLDGAHISRALIIDGFVLFATGTLSLARLEMALRVRGLTQPADLPRP